MVQSPVPLNVRAAILDDALQPYLRAGYRVVVRTETTAQLLKAKKASPFDDLLVLLTLGWVGLTLAKRDRSIFFTVTSEGHVRRIRR